MSTIKTISLAIAVNIAILGGLYIYFIYFGLGIITNEISGGITEIINKKIVEKNITEYRELTDLQNSIIKSIQKSSDAVVNILITKNFNVLLDDPYNFFQGAGSIISQETAKVGGGSGIIISSDGYIITNKHVVEDINAEYTVVTKQGQSFEVDKIWVDPIFDIAIIKIKNKDNQKINDLPIANITSVENIINVGQFVIAIGYALGEYENSATFGIISGKNRKLNNLPSDNIYAGLYQTDTPINAGNSGGPLLDINGNVIGMNTAISSLGQNIGFAIPLNKEFVKTTLDSILSTGKILRPYVGIEHIDLNKSIAIEYNLQKFEGVLVHNVKDRSPASKAGIQKGDIIIEVNGKKIDQEKNFLEQLYIYKPGETISFLIYRNNEYKKIDVILESRV